MRVPFVLVVLLLIGILALSACSSAGLSCDSEEVTPTPDPGAPIRADFSASMTSMKGNGWIELTSHSTGNIKNWNWDLDGDGQTDYIGPSVSHYFNKNGYYSVTLSVEGWDGTWDTLTRTDYIYVYGCKT
ncbi:PKD domain-containing protein [Chloroflexota bacterium]